MPTHPNEINRRGKPDPLIWRLEASTSTPPPPHKGTPSTPTPVTDPMSRMPPRSRLFFHPSLFWGTCAAFPVGYQSQVCDNRMENEKKNIASSWPSTVLKNRFQSQLLRNFHKKVCHWQNI